MKRLFQTHLILFCLAVGLEAAQVPGPERANRDGKNLSPVERECAAATEPVFKQFCFDCHSDKKTKAQINLQRMSSAPDFATLFKSWEKVIAMLEQKEMPPEEKPQPEDSQRRKLIATIQDALDAFVRQQAGDPGRIAMRQLTSAEYAY